MTSSEKYNKQYINQIYLNHQIYTFTFNLFLIKDLILLYIINISFQSVHNQFHPLMSMFENRWSVGVTFDK